MKKWAMLATLSMVSAMTPLFGAPALAAHVLITQDEANLPPPKGAVAVDRRGVTRGPKIDEDSVKVTYLRTPNVDLTPRIKPFVQMTGIDVPDAELPVGDHMVRVDVKDSDGRSGSASFVLQVAP
jgi:hypothetical protein